MTIFNFSQIQDGTVLNPAQRDKLVMDGGISAADVSLNESPAGLLVSFGGKTVTLANWTLDKIASSVILFNNASELLVGDTLRTRTDDNAANTLAPANPALDHNDQLRGLAGDDNLSGGNGDDLIFGNNGDDTLNGDDGDDDLNGGKGNDTINGGDGRDTVRIDDPNCGNDLVNGGTGNDKIFYGMSGRGTVQTLNGGAGNDRIESGGGNDIIDGGAGNDRIEAGVGADIIAGGNGADRITTGDGADRIVALSPESPATLDAFDTIVDFRTKVDKFDLQIAGTQQNYIEEDRPTDSFEDALARAIELLQANDGMKKYVFISGASKGWLFGDLRGSDLVPDIAFELSNGLSPAKLDWMDII